MQDREAFIRHALLRTVAWFDVIDYAPTWSECSSWIEWRGAGGFEHQAAPSGEELLRAREVLIHDGRLAYAFGRVGFPDRLAGLCALSFERTALFSRKLRRALRVARFAARLSSVRFIALVNTTALAHARNGSDLDFFVIVKDGRLWSTRLLAAGPYRVFGKLASADAKPDAVCLSYWMTDADLSLSSHMLPDDDPYYRYWFLSMMPLYDDGIGKDLWEANVGITALHPRAVQWTVSPDRSVAIQRVRIPDTRLIEKQAKRIQESWFPPQIRESMNRDSSVIVTDRVMKFHVDDARLTFRDRYRSNLDALGL